VLPVGVRRRVEPEGKDPKPVSQTEPRPASISVRDVLAVLVYAGWIAIFYWMGCLLFGGTGTVTGP
jgi:hypothetical protein